MLYGIKKIGVLGGHGDGANAIPALFATTPALKSYREGTAMRRLAELLAEIPGVVNLRPEAKDISWTERARRLKDAGCDLGVELHTNWSLNRAGQPNSNVFVVIVPKYNPVHNTDAQKAMATQLFKPLADAMGMEFEIRTKKGSGEWDWYSFLNEQNRAGTPWPFIVEHGYHIDYATGEERFRGLIAARYREIAGVPLVEPVPEPPPVIDETEPSGAIIHGGAFTSREAAASAVERCRALGYADAYAQPRNGVYYARCALNRNIEYALRNARELFAAGLDDAGIIIV